MVRLRMPSVGTVWAFSPTLSYSVGGWTLLPVQSKYSVLPEVHGEKHRLLLPLQAAAAPPPAGC